MGEPGLQPPTAKRIAPQFCDAPERREWQGPWETAGWVTSRLHHHLSEPNFPTTGGVKQLGGLVQAGSPHHNRYSSRGCLWKERLGHPAP